MGSRHTIQGTRNVRAALRGKPRITADTTYEQFKKACPTLATFDKGKVTVGRFATKSPWENHPKGDEFLYILDGEIDVILLRGTHRARIRVKSGSIFIVPRGVWHRQVPQPVASVLSALPTAHGPLSWEDDPRRKRSGPAARRER